MAIIRDLTVPSLGLPQQVIAPGRRPTMVQPNFYNQQLNQQLNQKQQQQSPTGGSSQQGNQYNQFNSRQQAPIDQPYFYQTPQDAYESQPLSGDYIKQQLAEFANRAAPPQLQPGERVTSPDMSLVAPTSFQAYYDQLSTIDQSGQEMLGAAQAKAAYQRQQQLNAIQNQQVPAFKGATLNNSGGGGGTATGSIPSNPKANFTYAQQIAPQFGWGASDLAAWYTLGMKESGWNNNAQNPTSTAYGIGQFLNSTWAGVGATKTSDPRAQVQAMAQYIKNRYGSPSAALAFHIAHNWY